MKVARANAKRVVVRIGVWFFFFSSRRRHTRFDCDWSSDVCSSDLEKYADSPQLGQVFEKEAKERADKLDAQHKALLATQQATLDQQRTMLLALVAEIGRASCRERV